MSGTKICIVGAGISGLIAAHELERAGFEPIILEASDAVGGRVRTDKVNGFLLDRGFQVLLTEYPEAKHYLDYAALNLKKLDSGAIILQPGNAFTIHDPLRNPLRMVNMAFSRVGTFMDKIKIFKLSKSLKKKSVEKIFSEASVPTYEFLRNYGFSNKIIVNFFKPFFKGIFLENELNTSSRMFNFVFKMFSMGSAAVPERGMQAIPEQLLGKLEKTSLQLNTVVERIEGNHIHLASGKTIYADKIIVATRPDKMIPQLNGQFKSNRKVINLYFSLEKSFVSRPMIILVPDKHFLINNMVFMTNLSKGYSDHGKSLLSVSITKPVNLDDNLAKLVAVELEALTEINAAHFKLIRAYEITEALPQVDDVQAYISASSTKVYDHVYLAGDYLLNGSINAAMTAGRKAAEAVVLSLRPTH